jgi:hypothetical protein
MRYCTRNEAKGQERMSDSTTALADRRPVDDWN